MIKNPPKKSLIKGIRKFESKSILKKIEPYMNNVARVLDVKSFDTHVIPYIYRLDDTLIFDSIPKDVYLKYGVPLSGYYYYEHRIMLISGYDAYFRTKNDMSILLYSAFHELRHVYQYDHAINKSYIYKIQQDDFLMDPYEIDADAFALLAVKKVLGYSTKHLDAMAQIDFSIDQGARQLKYDELMEIYSDALSGCSLQA